MIPLPDIHAARTLQLRLKEHREEPLLRHHPWVFSRALQGGNPSTPPGSLLCVVDHSGSQMLGQGFYEGGSIAIRMLTFGDEQIEDWHTFLRKRLQSAFDLRRALGIFDTERRTDCYRLCYGESDYLPGLIIDIYREVAVVQVHSVGFYPLRHLLAEVLCSMPELGVKYVYDKSLGTIPSHTPSEWIESNGYLTSLPDEPYDYTVHEMGYSFMPDWERGQKTGFFLDQRDNRLLVERLAQGRSLLNMCCYSGGFSVYGLGGGAREVVSVDTSARAIELCDDNVRRNFSSRPDILSRHHSVVADAFDYLAALPLGRHDLIVLDPPAFVKQRTHRQQGLSGYRRLNELALRAVAHGGLLATFSCSQSVTSEEFTLAVMTAATQAGRDVRILQRLGQSGCHPTNIFYPESEYLKGLLLYIS